MNLERLCIGRNKCIGKRLGKKNKKPNLWGNSFKYSPKPNHPKKTLLSRAYWNHDLPCEFAMCRADPWLVGSWCLGLLRTVWESSLALPGAGVGSKGEFLSPLKHSCQPEFLPRDQKEGRGFPVLCGKVPGCVYQVTSSVHGELNNYWMWLTDPFSQWLSLQTDLFDVFVERAKEKSFGLGLNCFISGCWMSCGGALCCEGLTRLFLGLAELFAGSVWISPSFLAAPASPGFLSVASPSLPALKHQQRLGPP